MPWSDDLENEGATDSGDDAGQTAGIGINAATGNWIGAGIDAIGLGMQIFGGMGQSKIASQEASVSADEAKQEQVINTLKQQQMSLDAGRKNVQTMRQVQQAQAMNLSRATSQGAQYGSGLAGGQAAAADQGFYNALGVNQNFQIGTGINAANNLISNDKMAMASLQGSSATNQGISSLGGSLISAGNIVGKLVTTSQT